MQLAHRIRLDLSEAETTYMARAAGTARFAWNWGLAEWQRQYAAWKADPASPKPNEGALRKQLNSIKRDEFPWMLEVTKCAPQAALRNLGAAFQAFWKGRAKYPQLKKKGVSRDSFALDNTQLHINGSRLSIPNLGWVKMREPLRFTGKLVRCTISREANHWFASISVDVPNTNHLKDAENQGVVGVDFGVSTMATLSTGEKVEGPKALRKALVKLKRLSRLHGRKQKGSSNRRKSAMRLARLHQRIKNVRQDALHNLTSKLTTRFNTIVIEDLNVRGMMSNGRLARAIADVGFFEARRQLTYKAAMRGRQLVVADRWFPSSKTCSSCGFRCEAMPLSVREWSCSACGAVHDRDVNAAVNLKHLAGRMVEGHHSPLAVSHTVSACGEDGSGRELALATKPASTKQEFNMFAHSFDYV